jgi:hypothetical protein
MGCDFYIHKYLQIYFDNQKMDEIKYETSRGYFDYNSDMDDDAIESYKESILTSKPLILFDKNVSETFNYSQYKYLVNDLLKKNNLEWSSVLKIVKIEDRIERD